MIRDFSYKYQPEKKNPIFTRGELLGAVIFFLLVLVFSAVILPIAIDKEIARMDAVAEYNCEHYGACGGR